MPDLEPQLLEYSPAVRASMEAAAPQQRIFGAVVMMTGASLVMLGAAQVAFNVYRLYNGAGTLVPAFFVMPASVGLPLVVAGWHAIRGAVAAAKAPRDLESSAVHGGAALAHAAAVYDWLCVSAIGALAGTMAVCAWSVISSRSGG